jgi:hypothetical protein
VPQDLSHQPDEPEPSAVEADHRILSTGAAVEDEIDSDDCRISIAPDERGGEPRDGEQQSAQLKHRDWSSLPGTPLIRIILFTVPTLTGRRPFKLRCTCRPFIRFSALEESHGQWPELYVCNPAQVVGLQHYYLAKIVLAIYDPCLTKLSIESLHLRRESEVCLPSLPRK